MKSRAIAGLRPRLLEVHWTGVRVLALVVTVLGGVGTLQGLAQLPRLFSLQAVPSFAFTNDQRLAGPEAIRELQGSLTGNLGVFIALGVLLLAVVPLFVVVIRALITRAPVSASLGGLFLGGSVLAGFLLGITALKVNELAIQSAAATPEEQTWLRSGITYLNQAHLIFVYGWFLFTGLGWIFLSLATARCDRWSRLFGRVATVAGTLICLGVLARLWLPSYGKLAPQAFLFVASNTIELGLALGFLATGLLAWRLSPGASTAPAAPPS
jgi:hypothetical protein